MKRNNKTPKGPRIPKGPEPDLTKASRPSGYFPNWSKDYDGQNLPDVNPNPRGRPPKVAYSPVPFAGGRAEFVPDSIARGRLSTDPNAGLPVPPERETSFLDELPEVEDPNTEQASESVTSDEPAPATTMVVHGSGSAHPLLPTVPVVVQTAQDQLREQALEFISQGRSLKEFTEQPGAPSMAKMAKLFSESEAAQAQLNTALALRADILFDEMMAIADSDREINHAKLMVETRKYAIERLNQKKYSLKHEITGELGLTINVKRFSDEGHQWKKDALPPSTL